MLSNQKYVEAKKREEKLKKRIEDLLLQKKLYIFLKKY